MTNTISPTSKEVKVFCNHCGVAVLANAVSCENCGYRMLSDNPMASGVTQKRRSPYGWGRFYAGVQIVGGLFLLVWLLLFWNQLLPNIRRMMIIGVLVALPLGYGLWNRTKWALYLLALVLVVEIGIWMTGIRHGHFRPVLALYLHAFMMYYYWRRQPDFA
jgi:DNA-directed RNA polymerase subunit RPC12/RpoP